MTNNTTNSSLENSLQSDEFANVGFLLVGHGTRSKAGQEQLRVVFQQFQEEMEPNPCELSFLELAEPDIATGIQRLAARGVQKLITVPVLLFTAGHAQRDIPGAVEAAAQALELEVLGQASSLECSNALVELSAKRFRESTCNGEPIRGCEEVDFPICTNQCDGRYCTRTALVMIGRGSNSDEATAEMRRFTELRVADTRATWHQTGFIHGQSPTVSEALDEAARTNLPLIVVQPHLFFEGELIDNLRAEVARRQEEQPNKQWVITNTLGTDVALAKTLASLARGTLKIVAKRNVSTIRGG